MRNETRKIQSTKDIVKNVAKYVYLLFFVSVVDISKHVIKFMKKNRNTLEKRKKMFNFIKKIYTKYHMLEHMQNYWDGVGQNTLVFVLSLTHKKNY